MMKKLLTAILVVSLVTPLLASTAHARRDTQGEVVFTDAMYGAAIGGLIGVAAYAIDDDDLGNKVGGGVIVGAILGLAYGVYETRSFVEYKDGKTVVSIPTPEVEQKGKETIYKVSLFRAEFK